MKIRNRSMSGAVFGVWVKPRDVFEVPDDEGKRYVDLGYAEEVVEKKAEAEVKSQVEFAVAPESGVESTALTTESVKRGPGRPRKDA